MQKKLFDVWHIRIHPIMDQDERYTNKHRIKQEAGSGLVFKDITRPYYKVAVSHQMASGL